MCLAIPGRLENRRDEAPFAVGTADFGGVRKEVCLAFVPEARIGDYVLVHVGFAISVIDEAEALRTLDVLRAMDGVLEAELGGVSGDAVAGPGRAAPAVALDHAAASRAAAGTRPEGPAA